MRQLFSAKDVHEKTGGHYPRVCYLLRRHCKPVMEVAGSRLYEQAVVDQVISLLGKDFRKKNGGDQ